MTTKKGSFPKPRGNLFRFVLFPPRPPEGSTPAPGDYEKYLEELSQKIPEMAEHFDRDTPGMHTSDTLDYGIVIRGEMILELDDGKTVPNGQNNYRTLGASDVRRVAASPLPFFMKNRLIVFERAAATARLSSRERQ
jgi:hypothetical protein